MEKEQLKQSLKRFLALHGVQINASGLTHCLWHNDEHESMKIYEDHGFCYACEKNADIYGFAAHFYGLDMKADFPEIKRRVASELGEHVPERGWERKPEKGAGKPVTLQEEAAKAVYTPEAVENIGSFIFKNDLLEGEAIRLEQRYPCKNEKGETEFIEARFSPSCFRDGKKRTAAVWWNGKKLLARNPPHGLFGRDLLAAEPEAPVLITEGPKCWLSAQSVPGFVPVAWNGGAHGQKKIDFSPLKGRRVYIWPDDDEAGMKSARATAKMLKGIAPEIIIVPPLPEARKIKAEKADIVEALQVMSPEEIAAYIGNQTAMENTQPSEARGIGGAACVTEEYRGVYGLYRGMIEKGLQERRLYGFEPNEDGQAKAAALYTAGYIRFANGLGWMAYDPETGSFRRDIGEYVLRYCLRLMARERWDFRYTLDDKEHYAYAKAACTEPGIRHVMKHLETDLFSNAADYDKNPYLLNCRGVTVNLRTGERRPSVPDDLHTKSTLCRPVETAPAPYGYPVFANFLANVTGDDASMTAWIVRYLGYGLSGDTKAAYFVNLHGGGRNGKGTLLHVMRQLFADYAAEIPSAVVVDNGKYQNIMHAHAALLGIRLGIAADVPPGKMNLESLKNITGGDPLRAEFKYQNDFEYRPIAKIILSTNEQLRLPDTGQSIRSRLRYVPFAVSFAGKEDTSLEDRILAEAPEILAVLIGEAVEYFKNPGPMAFPVCAVIDRETRAYITSEDVIGQFLEEKTVRAPSEQTRAKDLYEAFKTWNDGRGERKAPSIQWFGRKLAGRGLEKGHNMLGDYYNNLKII
jgi:putative DNA primase/helicase